MLWNHCPCEPGVALDIAGVVGGAEFADPNRRDIVQAEIGPELRPHADQTLVCRVVVEPFLLIEIRAVVVRGVDELVRNVECYRIGLRAFEVAAPPVAIVVVAVGTFHEDQQAGIDGCTALPPRSAASRQSYCMVPQPQQEPPLCVIVRLVAQVEADDGGVVQVTLASVIQSLIQALSGYCEVYHRPLPSAPLPASERWLSRMMCRPI